MPKSRIILALGAFIAFIPVLGFPHSWESFFQVGIGLSIVLLSVLISVDKRLNMKAKAQKRQERRKEFVDAATAAAIDHPELYGRRSSDKILQTREIGRRASDRKYIRDITRPEDVQTS